VNPNHYRRALVTLAATTVLGGASIARVLAQQAPATTATPAAPAFKAHVLSNAELDALLARPAEVLVLDVRRPDEITDIGGFPVYLNVQPADIQTRAAFIPRDRTIVTVSNHAARAGRAADVLASLGFKVAGAVGAQTYEEQGGKLTKLAKPAPREPARAAPAP
jgi:rhodanese-related sulfurtransferase